MNYTSATRIVSLPLPTSPTELLDLDFPVVVRGALEAVHDLAHALGRDDLRTQQYHLNYYSNNTNSCTTNTLRNASSTYRLGRSLELACGMKLLKLLKTGTQGALRKLVSFSQHLQETVKQRFGTVQRNGILNR